MSEGMSAICHRYANSSSFKYKGCFFYVSQYSVNWLKLRIKLNTSLYVLVSINAKCYHNAEC